MIASFEWKYVDSSNLDRISYDERTDEMHIQFSTGAVYVYYDVPITVYEELLEADSPGGHFNEHVRGEYEYERLQD